MCHHVDTHNCHHEIMLVYQNCSAFLVLAYPGCPGKRPLNECNSTSSSRSWLSAFRQLHNMPWCLSQQALLKLIQAEQGRLLLLSADHYLWSRSGQTSISHSSMMSLDSCSQQVIPNASHHFSVIFTGCKSQSGYGSIFIFWHTHLNDTAPSYPADSICWLADVEGCHLCTSATTTRTVLSIKWSMLGDWAYPVATSWASNSLPLAVELHHHPSPSDENWRHSFNVWALPTTVLAHLSSLYWCFCDTSQSV